jgi:hypothetical protein
MEEEETRATDEATTVKDREKPAYKEPGSSYKIKLRKADGTVLARCPTKTAGYTTAMAMYGRLDISENKSGSWELRSGGELMATVGR